MVKLDLLDLPGALRGASIITKAEIEILSSRPNSDMWKNGSSIYSEDQLIGHICKDMAIGYVPYLNGDTILLSKESGIEYI